MQGVAVPAATVVGTAAAVASVMCARPGREPARPRTRPELHRNADDSGYIAAVAEPQEPEPEPEIAWPPLDFPDAIATGKWPVPGMVHALSSSGSPDVPAQTFNELGVCLVRSLLPPAFAQECRKQAQESFDELMQHIARRELPVGDGTKGGFQEIVKRTAGRYEMLYKMDQGLLEADPSGQLGKVLADTWLQPFLNRTIGPGWRLMRQALLVSFPGATVQQWHVDGGHISNARHLPCHAMNVFIALDEISLDMGPTELRPASHFLSRDLSKQMFLAKIKKRLHPTLKPECQPGDAVIFDYRTLHRGLPNDSAATASAHDGLQQKLWADGMLWGGDEGDSGDRSWTGKARPMLELTFANERYNDLLNFPPKSVFD